MMWHANTNYYIANQWKLKSNTIHVMNVFAKIADWATSCKSDDVNDKHNYYVLYREKIRLELPFIGSLPTISRCIKELEDKKIIVGINKNTKPAYRLTDKGLEWNTKHQAKKISNAGESNPSHLMPPKKLNVKKEPRRHSFSLPKKCFIDECDEEYMNRLQDEAYKYCDKHGIPREEYKSFLRYYMKSDTKWRNWAAVFGDWCQRRKDNEKPKDGEFVKGGLY